MLSQQRLEAIMARRFAGVLLYQIAALLVFAVLLVRPDAAMAQATTAQPAYEVIGFRDARFGMTEQEIRASARNSFGAKDDEMTVTVNPTDGTTKLIVHVLMLEPGLGEGRVEYFFGYKSHKLIQINVAWGLDTNPPLNNSAMIAGAARLQRYFLGFTWARRAVRAGVPIDDSSVLVFSGDDKKTGTVTVVLEGVRYDVAPNGMVRYYPERLSPPKLVVSYIGDRNESDVRSVGRGAF
jgi:hypothetical protein